MELRCPDCQHSASPAHTINYISNHDGLCPKCGTSILSALSQVAFDASDQTGITPLHVAAVYGDPDTTKSLLGDGAEVNARAGDGLFPLHCACGFFDDVPSSTEEGKLATVKVLLEAGADPNIRAVRPEIAELPQYPDAIGSVRDRLRSDSSLPDNFGAFLGRTPLHFACLHDFSGAEDVVQLLLKAGASPNHGLPNSGVTPLSSARTSEVATVLLDGGADPNQKNALGETPLFFVAEREAPDVARTLLQAGAEVGVINRFGESPLHCAAKKSAADVTEVLCEFGANPNRRKSKGPGLTPLHIATQEGALETVKVLLSRGADPTIETKDGKTPLDVARSEGAESICEVTEVFLR